MKAQLDADSVWIVANYFKKEFRIPMRDGKHLFTAVYIPRDTTVKYPILMQRTPYTCRPYGEDKYPKRLGPSRLLMLDKYIFVYQDVRGRYMSEGYYENMTPHIRQKTSKDSIDEASDTYDTIEWLLAHLAKYTNGNVGIYGISYPGFYTTASSLCRHPALKASSPQAPMADIWYDDFHHQGAFVLTSTNFNHVFGYQKDSLTTKDWFADKQVKMGTQDGYQFYLNLGPTPNIDRYYGKDNILWQQIKDHPNYDAFWERRNILNHTDSITHAVMTVGGWYDAEDLYGSFQTYYNIERKSPQAYNICVFGPWRHGGWARDFGRLTHGNIDFGDTISNYYAKHIEQKFFEHFLKKDGKGTPPLPEASIFITGKNEWRTFDKWPPKETQTIRLYLQENGKLTINAAPTKATSASSYISDPKKPVPSYENIAPTMTREYMTDDQRFAARRPDVLTFETDILTEDITLVGGSLMNLIVATTGTDADWFVKLIDVYPLDHPNFFHNPPHIQMGGYQQMVRSEVFRSRWRESFYRPKPMIPNQPTQIKIPLQDIMHTFKKGHKIMIQIQSTAFPMIEINPQTYVANLYKDTKPEHYVKATQTIFHSATQPSYLEILRWTGQ
ncbi:CocE/NonD family hydrolase [Rhodoflexus sp.]